MPNTTKLFWVNPYQTCLQTSVMHVSGKDVLFRETIIFSESGGQEGDHATVNGIPVLESRISNTDIIYTLPDNHGLKTGDVVTLEINWDRRYKLMRLHFACELILVIINRILLCKGANEELKPEEIDSVVFKTGAHMSADGARVDFRLSTLQLNEGENISKYFPKIEQEFKHIINANLPILTGCLDERLQRRYWRIPGIATVPCGGTHVKTTAEIGDVMLARERTKDREKQPAERIKIKLKDSVVTSGLNNNICS